MAPKDRTIPRNNPSFLFPLLANGRARRVSATDKDNTYEESTRPSTLLLAVAVAANSLSRSELRLGTETHLGDDRSADRAERDGRTRTILSSARMSLLRNALLLLRGAPRPLSLSVGGVASALSSVATVIFSGS